jgi:hypothetical protein
MITLNKNYLMKEVFLRKGEKASLMDVNTFKEVSSRLDNHISDRDPILLKINNFYIDSYLYDELPVNTIELPPNYKYELPNIKTIMIPTKQKYWRNLILHSTQD